MSADSGSCPTATATAKRRRTEHVSNDYEDVAYSDNSDTDSDCPVKAAAAAPRPAHFVDKPARSAREMDQLIARYELELERLKDERLKARQAEHWPRMLRHAVQPIGDGPNGQIVANITSSQPINEQDMRTIEHDRPYSTSRPDPGVLVELEFSWSRDATFGPTRHTQVQHYGTHYRCYYDGNSGWLDTAHVGTIFVDTAANLRRTFAHDMDSGKIVMLVCVSNTATWQYAAAVINQE